MVVAMDQAHPCMGFDHPRVFGVSLYQSFKVPSCFIGTIQRHMRDDGGPPQSLTLRRNSTVRIRLCQVGLYGTLCIT